MLSGILSGQSTKNKGWLFLSHKQNLSNNWALLAEAQVRSEDKFESVNTLLLRGALSYGFNKKHSAVVGYTYKGDWEHKESKISYQPENRLYEQYLFNTKISKIEFTARARFEQRFVKEETKYKFSQRARAYINFQIPFVANADFSKGVYTSFQNEIFLNVQNKKFVNNDVFDQNRLQAGIGYRWSKHLDTDINYMFWRQKEIDSYISSNVFVLMLTTEL